MQRRTRTSAVCGKTEDEAGSSMRTSPLSPSVRPFSSTIFFFCFLISLLREASAPSTLSFLPSTFPRKVVEVSPSLFFRFEARNEDTLGCSSAFISLPFKFPSAALGGKSLSLALPCAIFFFCHSCCSSRTLNPFSLSALFFCCCVRLLASEFLSPSSLPSSLPSTKSSWQCGPPSWSLSPILSFCHSSSTVFRRKNSSSDVHKTSTRCHEAMSSFPQFQFSTNEGKRTSSPDPDAAAILCLPFPSTSTESSSPSFSSSSSSPS
mmetsp:Transcript_37420/g.73644  ORF Transcript_37420/g.73644 Transcript_37420/m.73644 type:complete len:264 (-) Transcript_37420:104-895(-)